MTVSQVKKVGIPVLGAVTSVTVSAGIKLSIAALRVAVPSAVTASGTAPFVAMAAAAGAATTTAVATGAIAVHVVAVGNIVMHAVAKGPVRRHDVGRRHVLSREGNRRHGAATTAVDASHAFMTHSVAADTTPKRKKSL